MRKIDVMRAKFRLAYRAVREGDPGSFQEYFAPGGRGTLHIERGDCYRFRGCVARSRLGVLALVAEARRQRFLNTALMWLDIAKHLTAARIP